MSGTGYKLLGFVVWQGGKWYVRRRVPARRLLAIGVLGAGAVALSAVLLRRAAS